MSTILITGASTGFGYEMSLGCARAGHTVIATMRNPQRSPQLGDIASKENLPITILPLDVDREESVNTTFRKVFDQFDKLDVLINNAGIGQWYAIEDAPMSEFKSTMETNFFGALRCIQAVLPHMRTNRSGHIINITSIAGKIASAAQGAYCASKFALEALSEILAQEVRVHNIKVNIVEPGIIHTPIIDKLVEPDASSAYPHAKRLMRLFEETKKNPVSPVIVAEKVLEIINADSYQLRYTVGPDAEPFLQWRASLTDEQFIDYGGLSDEEWSKYVRNTFGLEV